MSKLLKQLGLALTALIIPALGWAEDVVYTWTGKTSAAMTESIDLTKYESIAVQIVFKSLGTYANINNNDVALRIGSAEDVADGFGIKYKKGGGWGTFFFVGDTTSGNIATVGSTTNLTYNFTADVSEDGQTLNNISTITWEGSGGATTSGTFTPTASQSLKTSTLGYVTVNASMPDDVTITITATPIPDRVTYVRTIDATEADWSADAAWAKETDATATATVPVDDNNVTLTVNADSTVTMNAAATLHELTIDGDYALTLTGSETLTADSTAINTDVDVSGITASLGAVTIAKGKTLKVASDVTISSLSGTGTLHIVGVDETATGREGFTVPAGMTLKTSKNVTLTSGVYGGVIDVVDGNLTLNPTNTEGITGTLTIRADATFTNTRSSDAINYRGLMSAVNVYGTLNLGSTRWTTGNTTINVYGGATITGAGDSTGALDYHANATLNIKNDDTISNKDVTIDAVINTKNAGTLTINVDEGMSASFTQNIKMGRPIQKTGAGAATISGVISGSAQIQVAAGTIKLVESGTLGTGAITVTGGLIYNTDAQSTPTNTFTGAGTITADGCTLDLVKDADISGYTGSFALANNATLVIPAGSEGSMEIPTGSTLKLVIADDVDSHDASAVTGDGTFMFVDSAGEKITEGVEGKVFTRPVSTTPVCSNGAETTYPSITAAIEAGCSYIFMLEEADTTENVTLPSSTALYTYGAKITGNVTIQSGATLVAASGGTIDGTLTFEDGASMTLTGTQDFTVLSTVTFPTSGTFNLTMPSEPVVGNSLPFIVSGLDLKDDDVKVGTLSFTVSGGTANTTDYKLVSTSSGMYEVATVATPACTLDGTVYGSLEEAINVISTEGYTGDATITLSESANLASTLTIDIGDDKALTIDLNGKAISCYATDAEENMVPAIIIESGKLNLVSDATASVLTYTTTIVVGTETSTAPALVIGENVTVTTYGYSSAVNVVKGSIGGAGALLTGGDTEALTLASGTTLDATVGTLTLTNNALLAATATVTVLVDAEATVGDVIITCDTSAVTADTFTVSGAEDLGVSLDGSQISLVSTLAPTAQVGDQTYITIAEALAVENVTAVTIIADSTEDVTLPAGVTLTVADKVTYTGKVSDSYGTELVRNDTTGTYTVPTYVAEATTANGTAGYTTFAEAAAVVDVTGLKLLANVDITSNVTITVPVAGAYTIAVKSGATLDIAAATYTNDATKTFADGVTIASEEGAIVTLTSGGGYFSITGEGTVQAVGNANFIYGLGGVKNTISANLVIPAEKTFNVRAWNYCAPLGGGNITVNGTITANGGDSGTLKLKVASGKTLVATSAIDVPVVLADGAILDATNAITVNAAVSTEGTVTVNNATAEVAFLMYSDVAPENVGSIYQSEGLYASASSFSFGDMTSTSILFVPLTATINPENAEEVKAAQIVADAILASGDSDMTVSAISNPETLSVISDASGVTFTQNEGEDTYTATLTYDFGVSELTVDGEYVIVTVELGEGLDFADGASVTLVTGDDEATDAVPVDENGDLTLTPSGSIRYFKTSLTSPFKVKAKATK